MKKTASDTGNHSQRKQPAGEELPCRQGEQKEVQRLAKDRVHDATGSVRGAYQKSASVGHSAIMLGAGHNGDGERNDKCDEAQDGLDRQLQRLPADENRVTARQIGQMRPLQSQKRSVQNKKCGGCKSRERLPTEG